jgi:hypothetical protein
VVRRGLKFCNPPADKTGMTPARTRHFASPRPTDGRHRFALQQLIAGAALVVAFMGTTVGMAAAQPTPHPHKSNALKGGCEVTIHFRAPGKVIFLSAQDIEPTASSFKGIPAAGTEFGQGSNLTFSNEVYGAPSMWCQIGMNFRTIEPKYGESLFAYFNNPYRDASSWGCGTVPAGWTCSFKGNEYGQPLRVDLTVSGRSHHN